ncbi:uncharacterized protein LOC116010174 [Ipomoea triloba]|uniref:uncharacterized protein LOC116010174 n=1 Tax=Ipomoea triloba TaxID=35885 RepID=UPI00125E2035|nr:uncharacterized protein LOC116010174 [Ipomoea triloba]
MDQQRNAKLWHNSTIIPVSSTLFKARNFLFDWRASTANSTPSLTNRNQDPGNWSKPQAGFLKLNVDAAINKEIAQMGFGHVLRDDNGAFVAARGVPWRGVFSPREAEAVAVREALSWIKNLHYDKVYVETDSLLVMQALNAIEGDSYFHLVIRDIKNMLCEFTHVFLNFAKRSANRAAHELARQPVSLPDCTEWFVNPPPIICNALSLDVI